MLPQPSLLARGASCDQILPPQPKSQLQKKPPTQKSPGAFCVLQQAKWREGEKGGEGGEDARGSQPRKRLSILAPDKLRLRSPSINCRKQGGRTAVELKFDAATASVVVASGSPSNGEDGTGSDLQTAQNPPTASTAQGLSRHNVRNDDRPSETSLVIGNHLHPVTHGFPSPGPLIDWGTQKVLCWWLSNKGFADVGVEGLNEAIARF